MKKNSRISVQPIPCVSTHNSHYVYGFLAANIVTIIYIEALGIVLLITLLTLVYQLEKAARVNVASVVKTE